MKRLLLIALLSWNAQADTWNTVKEWVSQAPNRSLYIHYNGGYATVDDEPVVGAAVLVTYVPKEPIDHHTAVTGVIFSDDDCISSDENGRCWDHTAVSGVAENRGLSGAWGGHFQCKNIGEGVCRGLEVNVEASGPVSGHYWEQPVVVLDAICRGIEGARNPQCSSIITVRTSEDLPSADPAWARTGIKINGNIRHAVYINTQSTEAVVIQPGQKICLDGADCKHSIRYDPVKKRTVIK